MSALSLDEYLARHRHANVALADAVAGLVQDVTRACVRISAALRQGALAGILGSAGSGNVQGEDQKKLDVLADEWLIESVRLGGHAAGLASEEQDDVVALNTDGRLLLLFDPLDGSSNIDVNISVGTIFSVLPRPTGEDGGGAVTAVDFLQPGRQQLAAGYVLYGPSTLLVLTLGQGVNVFTLDDARGVFFLTAERCQIAPATREFAINMSNQRHWEAPMQRYIAECLAGSTGVRGKDFNMRWVASMVGDVHRILTRGGVFMYPYDRKDPSKAGRLRLMYEASPMAYLIEQAGGQASTARERLLDVVPHSLHQRIPVVLGSREEVTRVDDLHRQADA